MILKKWESLSDNLKNESVRKYYEILKKKRSSLYAKRIFDFLIAFISIILIFPALVFISIAIKIDSRGPVIYRQDRLTQYGNRFKILKFRTMVNRSDSSASQLTVADDKRITRVGKILRKYRFDEFPQLFNIIRGEMSFVGTRPEVFKYTEKYSDEMKATLLLPAGVTSEASIRFRDEDQLLSNVKDVDEVYVNLILPEKMKYNLKNLEDFSLFNDIKVMLRTVKAVIIRKSNKKLYCAMAVKKIL